MLRGARLSRRSFAVLTAGVVTLGVAGCARDEGPDELEALYAAALDDAGLARMSVGVVPERAATLVAVSDARTAHADALGAEIRRARPDRANRLEVPRKVPAPPASAAVAVETLRTSLVAARDAGSALAVTSARYRAGLVAAVAASCAGWAEALAG